MSRVRRSTCLLGSTLALTAAAGVIGAAVLSAGPAGPAGPAVASAPPAGYTQHVSDGEALNAGQTVTGKGGGSYAVASVVAGRPVRWNPCAVIHWRANVSRGPAGGLAVLRSAVAAVAAASGTTWVYDGPSSAVPSNAWVEGIASVSNPVLLGWTDGAGSDLLHSQPSSVLGMTSVNWLQGPPETGSVAAIQTGVIALNRDRKLPLRGKASWSTVALHELGHVMGLAHPAGRGELMDPVLATTMSGLQSGDRTGLRALGRSAGCIDLGL